MGGGGFEVSRIGPVYRTKGGWDGEGRGRDGDSGAREEEEVVREAESRGTMLDMIRPRNCVGGTQDAITCQPGARPKPADSGGTITAARVDVLDESALSCSKVRICPLTFVSCLGIHPNINLFSARIWIQLPTRQRIILWSNEQRSKTEGRWTFSLLSTPPARLGKHPVKMGSLSPCRSRPNPTTPPPLRRRHLL